MIKLTENQILMMHQKCIEKFGGLPGVRDENLLHSACISPYQTFMGEDLFPDIYDKAARYLWGFATNQIFFDGNKRTAAMVLLVFLYYNNIVLAVTDEELEKLVLRVANKEIEVKEVKNLLIKFSQK